MSARRWMWAALFALGALALGCEEEAAAPADPEPVVVVEEAVPEPEPTAAEIPVAEDFAEEVESEITDDNYEAQLAEIEAELAD